MTRDDRELLELAAKAAGYAYNRLWFHPESGLLVWEPPTDYGSRNWNPLTDDGDALRLAVTLKLRVSHHGKGEKYANVYDGSGRYLGAWPHGDDPYSATRRAIVRAAAEIGRSMK